MPRIPEAEKYDDDEVWLIPCDCGDNHYFKLVWWDDDPDMRYASLEHVSGNPGWGFYGIKHRLRRAWDGFRSKEYSYGDIVLNDKALTTIENFIKARGK